MNKYRLWFLLLAGLVVFLLYFTIQANTVQNRGVDPLASPGGQQLPRKQILIYNRVPKTGSTSLMNIAYELHSINRFRVVQLRLIGSKHILSRLDEISFSQNMSDWKDLPALYHGHFAYFDPRSVGVDLTPVYINLVREPLERLVSYYYFLRYGDDILDKVRSKAGDTTTFDECVEQAQPDCDPKKLWMQIPFFCGSAPECWDPGSRWALEQAKTNLVNKYLVVGVTEDLESFAETLESLLPTFFHGAVQYLRETGKAHIKKTKHKDTISKATTEKLKNTRIYQLEKEFYTFAVRTFKSIKKSVLKKNKETYVYEKVRPKFS